MADPRFFTSAGPITLKELAHVAGAELSNADENKEITGVAPIESAGAQDITFLSNPKYLHYLAECKAGACILAPSLAEKAPASLALLLSADPYYAYARIAQLLYPESNSANGISPAAHIAVTAKIGKNCQIAPGVVIEDGVEIGDNCTISANSFIGKGVTIGNNCWIANQVSVTYAVVGNNVVLHQGVRIGQDGFGFATHKGMHVRVPQLGRVVIKDHVNIGANTTIDRGAGPDTVIGEGCQIDNLVQIGHNVQMGRGCVIVAQVGIAGSTKLGDYVVAGGQVGIAGHLTIGSGAQFAAQSGIARDVAPQEKIGGSPAVPIRQWHKQNIVLKKLAEGEKK